VPVLDDERLTKSLGQLLPGLTPNNVGHATRRNLTIMRAVIGLRPHDARESWQLGTGRAEEKSHVEAPLYIFVRASERFGMGINRS